MAQTLSKEAKKYMRSVVYLPELEVFRGARGPEPGSGLDKFHWEGIPVILAPVSQLIPTPVMTVLAAAKEALAPALNASTDQYVPSQGAARLALQVVPPHDMPLPSAAITAISWAVGTYTKSITALLSCFETWNPSSLTILLSSLPAILSVAYPR